MALRDLGELIIEVGSAGLKLSIESAMKMEFNLNTQFMNRIILSNLH